MPFRQFVKGISMGARILALMIFAGWLLLIGAKSGVIWSALWLPLRDVPLDTQPHDKLSATRLALTLARAADCGNFEPQDFYQDHSVFTCQMIGNNSPSFIIWIFYNQAIKNKIATDYRFGLENWMMEFLKDSPLYKIGPFYLVSENIRFTNGDGIPEHAIQQTEDEYIDFPGVIVMLQKSNLTSTPKMLGYALWVNPTR
jgi:hypothetical protein